MDCAPKYGRLSSSKCLWILKLQSNDQWQSIQHCPLPGWDLDALLLTCFETVQLSRPAWYIIRTVQSVLPCISPNGKIFSKEYFTVLQPFINDSCWEYIVYGHYTSRRLILLWYDSC